MSSVTERLVYRLDYQLAIVGSPTEAWRFRTVDKEFMIGKKHRKINYKVKKYPNIDKLLFFHVFASGQP